MAADQGRPPHADRRADRLRQDAGRLPGGDRRPGAAGPRGRARRRDAGRLRLAAQGAVERHPAQPRSAARRHPRRACASSGLPDVEIRTWVRTGDTPPGERERMRRRPPHIVVTTPESLYILLGSESGRAMLATTRTVIVDEIHALAPNKRGSHLALSLERLAALCGDRLLRIGLSATQKPIEEVARFLVGAGRWRGADCAIVDTGHRRARDLALEVPDSPLEAVMSAEVWEQVYDRLAAAGRARTARRSSSSTRAAWPSARRASCPSGSARTNVAAHHGSLAKEQRLDAEQRLKARRAEGAGRHRLARARHRHRRRRPGLPARLAALDRQLPAARRPLRPRRRRHAQGPAVPAVARRAGRMRGAARQRAPRRARPPVDPRRSRSTCWRSRSSPRSPRANGARTSCSRWCAAPGPTATLPREDFDAVVAMLAEGFTHAARPARRADPPRRGQPRCCAAGAARGSPR